MPACIGDKTSGRARWAPGCGTPFTAGPDLNLDSETAIQRLVTECFDSLEEQCTAADPWRCVPTLGTSSSCTVSATFASTAPINMMVIDVQPTQASSVRSRKSACGRPPTQVHATS